MKKISILGSTGSVGINTLKVIKSFNNFKVKALCVKNNIDLLEKQAKEFNPDIIAVYDEKKAKELKKRVSCKVVSGIKGIVEAASNSDIDFVMVAIGGNIALLPLISAIKSKKVIGLANKEILVSAGEMIMELKNKYRASIIPVDSEHSGIFQCIRGEKKEDIKKIIITSSGGPFRDFSMEDLKKVTPSMAIKHPTYSMGKKISVDSSTLMNKGLEVIEAFWLFSIDLKNIEVVVHPTSYVHSFVEFVDNSILAQINTPDMRLPIQYSLFYPDRVKSKVKPLDFTKYMKLEFYPLGEYFKETILLAYEALKVGKSMPCYLNAANEVLVDRFLNKEIGWLDIKYKLKKLLSSHKAEDMLCLDAVLEIDKKARMEAQKI